ncbi:MAG TPA: hypothetical protein VGI40_26940 [Pirellulaceae bacterium]|jgi:hypothetical protein
MRYRLRTLLIVLALAPPVLAWLAWPAIDRIIHPPSKYEWWLLPVAPDTFDIDP